jgi:HEPN domain-containing protein
MPLQRHLPESAQEWLNRARSDLALAKVQGDDIYLEDLCFHAQQAVEKAVKALLIKEDVEFPYVHDISQLMTLFERAGCEIPDPVKEGERLTRLAVIARYPGIAPIVTEEEYQLALSIAEEVVRWTANLINESAADT